MKSEETRVKAQALVDISSNATATPWKLFEEAHDPSRPYLIERRIGTDWYHPQLQGSAPIVTMATCISEPHHQVYIDKKNADYIIAAVNNGPELAQAYLDAIAVLEKIASANDDVELCEAQYAARQFLGGEQNG